MMTQDNDNTDQIDRAHDMGWFLHHRVNLVAAGEAAMRRKSLDGREDWRKGCDLAVMAWRAR